MILTGRSQFGVRGSGFFPSPPPPA
jgi:hypothetical protein